MKTRIFIIILLTLFFNEFVYSQWQQIHPLTSSTILNSIYFVGDVGYAVGSNGEIFKTVNKGIDWYQQSSGITENLNAVFLTNSDHVITVGNNGMILRTSNGGNEWMMPDSKTTSNINSIYLIDNLSYAVGDNGLILKSIDDGVSWITQTSGTTDNLNSVYFTSSDTGYIVGNNGTILFTNNGGQEWNSKNTGTGADYTCIQFINKNNGIAVGGNYASYEKIDLTISDNSLNTSVTSTPARFKTIQYTSPQTCYAVTSSGNLYYTFNNWQTTISINYSGKLTSQYFFNDSIGFLVGKANYINATRNGVAAYSVNLHQFNDCISGDLNDVLYVNENTAYIVGNNGLLLKTIDKGNKWAKQTTTINDNFKKIYFLNEDTGFVSSSTGTILKTKNGGITWSIINSGVSENISSIYFKDSNNGFLLSESGYLQKTVDGGDSWNSYKKLLGGGQIINERTFYIEYDSTISSTNYSYMLRTTDSGVNWDTINQAPNWYGNKFIPYFVDSVNGIALNFSTSSGWIASTSNGGKNWNNYYAGCGSCSGGHIIDIFFIDKNNIYAVSYGGCFFNSVNGGINWTKTTLPGYIGGCGAYSYSNCVAFYNKDNGLVGGHDGVLFRYSNSSINFTPTDINLSNLSIAENNASNTIIGILNTVADNSSGRFTYTLDSTSDNIANSSFLIMGDTLKSIRSFDFETKSTYNIRIKTTTTEGNSMEKNFIIAITDVNESPVVKTPIEDKTILHSQTFTYNISDSTFYDSDVDDNLMYSASLTNGDLLPNWLSFNSSTRTFSGSLNNICTLIDTISVQVTDKAGLKAYDDFILTVNNIPTTPVITLNNNILQSSETDGNQWYHNNNILSDATNSTLVPVLQGDYYVVITKYGCSSEPSNTIAVVSTKISETAGCNNGISVYPNPTSDILKISINQKFDSDYSIEVFNNVGLLLQTLNINKSESNIKLDLSSFSAGVYILRICNITIYYQIIIIKK